MHAEALNADAGQFDLAIDMIHDAGCKAAIAMKPDYDVELIKPYIAKLDMVLPMSVFPGLFRPELYPRNRGQGCPYR